jgi:hypothetical protein
VLGLEFAFSFVIAYASSRTLATAYGYTPIKIGFVILSMGVGKFFFLETFKLTDYHLLHLGDSGGIVGSVCGGRWSDYVLARQKVANGGNSYPEVSVPYFCTL